MAVFDRKFIFLLLLSVLGILGWKFGLLNYRPEINTFIGSFGFNNRASVEEGIKDSSGILPNSIYSTLYDVYHTEGTDFERKNLFEKYKDLRAKDKGKFFNLGEDGKTVIIKGNNNGKEATFACIFQDKWKKRLGAMQIGDDILFEGIISDLNLHDMAILIDCEITE